MQSVSHLMLHEDWSWQVTELAPPRFSLQTAVPLHVAIEPAPALKSQSELAAQVMRLSSPPLPLHCDVSAQVKVNAPLVFPLHFADDVQARAQSSLPHSVLQSAPATHVQEVSAQVQPMPMHVGAPALPPQAAAPRRIAKVTSIHGRIGDLDSSLRLRMTATATARPGKPRQPPCIADLVTRAQ